MNAPQPEHTDTLYDLALIGAGGAGMCLLQAWHQAGVLAQKRVLVLEAAIKSQNDRTWCFWAKSEDSILQAFGHLVSSSWSSALVGGKEQSLVPYRYHQIRSSALYASVQGLLTAYEGVHWVQTTVSLVTETPTHCQLETAAGRFQAAQVFDSRLEADAFDSAGLWQSFFGMRIRLAAPRFVPDQMELMNFDIVQQGSTQFVYVLPVSETEGLIELTRFDCDVLDQQQAEDLLTGWITSRFGEFKLEEAEHGRIPMQMQLNPSKPHHSPGVRHIPIGTAAGAVKASTGFAIKNMWQHAENLTTALVQQSPFPTPYHPQRHSFYDDLLLDILKKTPSKGKSIFLALFKKVPLPRIFHFLDEKSTLKEELPILGALPIPTFLMALGRKYLRQDLVVLLLLALCVLLQWLRPAVNELLLPVLLALGLIFPGIPHGAVDHLLAVKPTALPLFIAKYVAIMLAVVFLWWQMPSIALLAFLSYSAWHFGETDAKLWGQTHAFWAWSYGVSALGFLLFSHPVSLQYYFTALGTQLVVPQHLGIALFFGLMLLFLSIFVPSQSKTAYWLSFAVIIGGSALPLLAAFGFYFIGLHSWRGWRHLQKGLAISHRQLFIKALPFSLAAWVLFIGLGVASQWFDLSFNGWVPAFFVFLAAVSAPHILSMHYFYKGRWSNRSTAVSIK